MLTDRIYPIRREDIKVRSLSGTHDYNAESLDILIAMQVIGTNGGIPQWVLDLVERQS